MTPKALLVLLGLAGLLLAPPRLTHAQEPPLVVFITGVDIQTSTFAQSGPPGVQKFADIFDSLGAQVRLLEETQPIPPQTQVVIITRPLEPLNFTLSARLWIYLQNGGNLLIAADPTNYFLGSNNVDEFVGGQALFGLIATDYGMILQNSVLIPDWANAETILDFGQSFQQAQPEIIANPITQPHQQYGLPIRFWGARDIVTDPLGLYSVAVPLFYNEDGYAENNTQIFPTARGRRLIPAEAEFGFDIEQDELGRLHIAAYAQNTRHRSRVIFLGDSEMLQNGFGLSGTILNPEYPGNAVFAQRVAAWLLELPVSSWPTLSTNFIWLAIDTNEGDWEDITRRYRITDQTYPGDVPRIRGFYDDRYVYLGLDAADGQAVNAVRLTLPNGQIEAGLGQMTYIDEDGTEITVPDGAVATGDFTEIRIPLRLFWPDQIQFTNICTLNGCIDSVYQPTPLGLRAPHDFALSSGPLGMIGNPGTTFVNVRGAPDINSPVVGLAPVETEIAVLGRNADASWYRVRSAQADGWVAEFLLEINGDPARLPLIDES